MSGHLPAHPVPNDQAALWYPGVTIRDYFAAAAMQGLLSCDVEAGKWPEFACRAYSMADAMLEERHRDREGNDDDS